MRIKILALLIFGAILSGCGAHIAEMYGLPIVNPTDETAVQSATTVNANQHTGTTEVSGPIIFHDGDLLGKTYHLRSWIAPNNPGLNDRFQIYVTASFNGWAFLDQAYAEGKMLDTTTIDRKVGSCHSYGCRVTETIGVNLSRTQMREFSAKGLHFQIQGKRDSIVLIIPAPYFAAVLKAHDKVASR